MKKLLGIVVMGLLWCTNVASAEFKTFTYINCEPKEQTNEDIKKQIKYLAFTALSLKYYWDPKEKSFLKTSDWIPTTYETKYVFRINQKWEEAVFKFDELEINRTSGLLEFRSINHDTAKKKLTKTKPKLFQCEKISEADLPKIKIEQKF